MLDKSKAYSGFAVDDMAKAREFYGETLGVKTSDPGMGDMLLQLDLADGERATLVYEKPDLDPGNYTILNFPVSDVDAAVDALTERGVTFERYDGFNQDEKGIARPESEADGPTIAWFKDPAGNILAIHEG